jgi:glycosyltransferase involved in cell wall biosynthesis
MSEPLGVSIIVVNYNNEQFLAAAIDSALGQDYSICEVIVVDDCSTDNSRAVIARYGHRIRSLLRETNGGQIEALNSAWPLARYPILIFLDSDDILLAHAASSVAARWTAGTAKTQFPLVTIDKTGREIGHVAPIYPRNLDTAIIRAELLRTGGSPNSPASGNAYSRSLLGAVMRDHGFDLKNSREHWMDAILECNAPFYGEVVTLYQPLACYRRHDNNLYAATTIDSRHFNEMLRAFASKLEYLAERCRGWNIPFDPTLASNRSLWSLECRLVVNKLTSSERRSGNDWYQPVFRILYRALHACIDAELPISDRLIRAGWLISIALGTRPVARRLIALRFVASERPAWYERLRSTEASLVAGRSFSRK